jgi:hypothetical protein
MEDSGRDPIALGKYTIVALYIWLASDILLGLAAGYQLMILSALDGTAEMTLFSSLPATAQSDMISGVIGLAYSLAFLAAGFLVLRWIYRVNKNAHVLTDWMQMTPGWNIGFFFIPIALLWKPFEGVRQSWQATFSPEDPDAEPVPDLLRWWWGLWLASSMLGNISLRMSLNAQTVSDQLRVDAIDLFSVVIDIPLVLVLATMIRKLSMAQSGVLKRSVFA